MAVIWDLTEDRVHILNWDAINPLTDLLLFDAEDHSEARWYVDTYCGAPTLSSYN